MTRASSHNLRAAWRPSRRGVALAAGLTVTAVACIQVEVPESLPGAEEGQDAQSLDAPADDCTVPTGSLRPDGEATTDVASGSYMAEVVERGELRVGVDLGTLGFSSINAATGELEGFDVDMAREVARALLGDPEAVRLIGMASSDRVDALVEGRVDLIAHNFTITCRRWERIAFSTEYFSAGQRILVRQSDDAQALEDLAGDRVCVTRGSTALDYIEALPPPRPLPVQVPARADCLMLLQEGQVDALAGDDAILAGMAVQDPSVEVRGEVFSAEPYGLGLPPGHPEWVRYVNAVLEEVRSSGRWEELYDQWLGEVPGLASEATPPRPTYRD